MRGKEVGQREGRTATPMEEGCVSVPYSKRTERRLRVSMPEGQEERVSTRNPWMTEASLLLLLLLQVDQTTT